MRYVGPIGLLFLTCCALQSQAGELSREPYVLRLVATLQRATNFASAAGLQASAAHPAGWSVNPAADDVLRDPCDVRAVTATATNMHAFAQSGAWFTASAATASIRLPSVGTMPIAYARTDTIDGRTEQGFDNPLRSNEFFWGYSRRLSDACAVGLQARYVTADIQEENLTLPGPVPTRFETDLLWNADLNLGVRWALNTDWSVGVVCGAGWGRATIDAKNIFALPNPVPPPAIIPAGTLLMSFDESLRSRIGRIGIGYTPSEWLGIYADGEYFHLGTAQAGTIDVSRALLGAEVTACEHWSVRIGGSLDNSGQFTFSTGVGIRPRESVALEVGYQYNAFPELDLEFGRFDLVTLSGVIRF